MMKTILAVGVLAGCLLHGVVGWADDRLTGKDEKKDAPKTKANKNDDQSLQKRHELLKKFKDGTLTDSEKAELRKTLQGQAGRSGGRTTPKEGAETVGNRDVKELQYPSSDGKLIPAVLSMPKGDGPFPIVVTIHGGQGNRDYDFLRSMAAPNKVSPTVTAFNEQPWAVLAISYRAGKGSLFGREEDDVIAGIRFAKNLPKIDPERVGVIGGSHGGHLALRAAEVMGKEFRCVVAGSPWCTNPQVYIYGKADEPPLSLLPQKARDGIMDNGKRLQGGLERNRGKDEIEKLFKERSIEANAEKIVVPALFITSTGDEQVPHVMVKPIIDKLKATGRDVTIYTAEHSPHGFYWGREAGGARLTRGEKTAEERAEELKARKMIMAFFKAQFDKKPAATGPNEKKDATPKTNEKPKLETKSQADPEKNPKGDDKRTITPEQAAEVEKLRSRLSEMKIPDGLEKRTIKVGDNEHEYFIYIPTSVKGKLALVVFALHGGASSTGLAMHAKADFSKLGVKEGFLTVYQFGVNG